MKTFNPWMRALCALLLLSGAAGCKVEFPDDVPYTCEADADCGGDSYLCTALPNGGPKYCCLPEEGERCNNVDDDCDGSVDELEASCYTGAEGTSGRGICREGRAQCGANGAIVCVNEVRPINEECNGADDDCDGSIDEDFDLKSDPGHCGRCEVACNFLQNCVNGECVRRGELDCGNGRDDNGDGAADCADLDDCNNQSCGQGCVCRNGRKAEGNCGGGADDDGDTLIDCADREDCDNKACGAGCACTGGRKVETECGNSGDDDGDGSANCADSDCNRRACGDGQLCQNGACSEGDCANGVDDDRRNGTDCADAACDGELCGAGCVCSGRSRVEANCSDGISNDGDNLIDCADPDCNLKACAAGQSDSAARCESSRCAEENCRDTIDNDGNNGADCMDRADCDYAIISQPGGQVPSQVCIGGAAQETNCDNGMDDDGDTKTDCVAGRADENCVNGECGWGCRLTNCQRSETICNDGVDNDGNNGADCADQVDCPAGTTCRKNNGTPGTCQGNKSCG